ncbi:MAG: ferrous iron transport protein B [Thermodesulfovibrionales bacterium]
MECHSARKQKRQRHKGGEARDRVVLIGGPNVGKSVIFGLLTGKYVTVSNYPGTTVEVFSANLSLDGKELLLVDTPGVNSLLPMSEDEKVTRDILLDDRPSTVVQVGDAKNLKRTLLITMQLAEMGLPLVLDLNMQDEALDRGINIDLGVLREALGVDVVATVAPERKGIRDLKSAMARQHPVPRVEVRYGQAIEEHVRMIEDLLPEASISRRSIALMVLAGDESLRQWLKARMDEEALAELERLREECQRRFDRPIGLIVNETRLRKASEIAGLAIKRSARRGGSVAALFGRASMHPIYGLPVLFFVLLGLYEFVGVFGAGTLVDFFEGVVFERYLNPVFVKAVDTLVPVAFLRDMLVGEYGVLTMALTYAIAIILPITTTFFIFFSILEDSGYLPRLAIMSNRVFNAVGLSGKAVLPMVLGLGCGTMAVMTTRILETRRERVIATFLLALAIPCSAQLGVILGMLGALSAAAMYIWIISVLAVLLFAGFLASRVMPGERSDFFMEIPPIRMPSASNVAAKTMGRAVWYLKEAVPLFVLGTLALFILDKIAVLGVIERAASPVVTGVLGLPPRTTEAFLIGFFRRDYGAAGLFAMASAGLLTPVQSVVSLVTITLFVPCLANFFMIIKERGVKMALAMLAIVIPTAIAAGGFLNWLLRTIDIRI